LFSIHATPFGYENAYVENAYVENAYVENAYVENAYVENAYVDNAYVENAYVENAYVENAYVENVASPRLPEIRRFVPDATPKKEIGIVRCDSCALDVRTRSSVT
jgi:hypothetical protein